MNQNNIRWLVVNTDILNVDHKPKDEFEETAAKLLAAGKQSFEQASQDQYRFAGAIGLKSQCLKCHVKTRTSLEDRTAGLIITMPIKRKRHVAIDQSANKHND